MLKHASLEQLYCDAVELRELYKLSAKAHAEKKPVPAPLISYMNVEYAVIDRVLYVLGANDPQDWIQGMRVLGSNSFMGGRVHSGFLDHYQNMHTSIVTEGLLGKIDRGVGHSLGGVTARLFCAQMGIPCNTFGRPTLWEKPANLSPEATEMRVYHRSDPAVRLWPAFKHLETAKLKLGPPWWVVLLECFTTMEFKFRKYHWMGTYVDHLEELWTGEKAK